MNIDELIQLRNKIISSGQKINKDKKYVGFNYGDVTETGILNYEEIFKMDKTDEMVKQFEKSFEMLVKMTQGCESVEEVELFLDYRPIVTVDINEEWLKIKESCTSKADYDEAGCKERKILSELFKSKTKKLLETAQNNNDILFDYVFVNISAGYIEPYFTKNDLDPIEFTSKGIVKFSDFVSKINSLGYNLIIAERKLEEPEELLTIDNIHETLLDHGSVTFTAVDFKKQINSGFGKK